MQGMVITVTATMLLWVVMGVARAHQATEIYIPVGQSPGISNKLTDIGTIDAVDAAARQITVGSRTVAIVADTKIYVDRSLLKVQNLIGQFSDLQPGRTVEVRYQDPARRQVARWVKVQVQP